MSEVYLDRSGYVAIVEIRRGPDNFIDERSLGELASAFEACDSEPEIRCIVLCSEGKNFCAGVNFASTAGDPTSEISGAAIYRQALRLFRCVTPVVAVIQGAAVGAGLGLSLVADFRLGSPQTRFTANFNRLGIHPGFGLSVTLPRIVGAQHAAMLFYSGRRVGGEEAYAIGLLDQLAPHSELRAAALALAVEIAQSAPIAVVSTRRTLRRGLADSVSAALDRELAEQEAHFRTEDFKEGVKAMKERRAPVFASR